MARRSISEIGDQYEDVTSPKTRLEAIFDFLKLTPKLSTEQIIFKTSFQSLAKMEAKTGFKEASEHSKFFRVGKKDQWSTLSTKQREKIEQKFAKTMKVLGYL